MNILFYVEPLIERDLPYWKDSWINYSCLDIINTLQKTNSIYQFCLLTSEPLAENINFDTNITICTLTQNELLSPFGTNYLDATSAWHLNLYSKVQINYYKNIISNKLEQFVPDIIITFTPVPFLNELYPDSLVLHHEYSLFSRRPYPVSWFLDPIGGVSQSFFNKFEQELNNYNLSLEQIELLDNFKLECRTLIKQINPFENVIPKIREFFNFLVYVPLQFSRYYLFDDLVDFKCQYEYCVYVLDNTPKSIGVVVNTHPEYPVLSNDAIKFLRWKYPHFIYLDGFSHVYASGQFIMPLVDGVITVSSSIGLQTPLFDKKLITLGKQCFDFFSDSKCLENIEGTLSKPINNKDVILYYFLTRYAITKDYLYNSEWLENFLKKSLERYRKNGISVNFYDLIDSDEKIFKCLSSSLISNEIL